MLCSPGVLNPLLLDRSEEAGYILRTRPHRFVIVPGQHIANAVEYLTYAYRFLNEKPESKGPLDG
jgi:hypothetical protein